MGGNRNSCLRNYKFELNRVMRNVINVLFFLVQGLLLAQESDSLKTRVLGNVIIRGSRIQDNIGWLDDVKDAYLTDGKKSEKIPVSGRNLTYAEKYGRQVFARVPGVFVYDMDGTGNQMNISVRGLDAHRNWEFNVRKDGIITNSDMYGYPASHYNIPLEAVERVELVRGTASLQYGAQFGGMLNFISKQPDSTAFSLENINTVGAYGLMSSFFSASGRKNKFAYMMWVNKKVNGGYRDYANSQYDAQAVTLYFYPSERFHIKTEWTRSYYLTQSPGPLTDSMFHVNPRQATRTRNYYSPDIHVPSITMQWSPQQNTIIQFATSAVLGSRSSVMFDKPANIPDEINPVTGKYANRQVDIDNYRSYTSEIRLRQQYRLLGIIGNLAAGLQYMNNDLHRRQLGKGTTGTGYDLSLTENGFGRDLHYRTKNLALFAESSWMLTGRLTVNGGFRVETGETQMGGVIVYYPPGEVPNTIRHRFPLFGVSAQFELADHINLYAGISQSYRPVIFKDIIPASVYEVADKNLKDAKGYNAEAGIRGSSGIFTFDFSVFELLHKNRLGTLAQTDALNNLVIFRTNVGNSCTRGAELLVQGNLISGTKQSLSVFVAASYMDARYRKAVVRSGNANVDISGNKVESVPEWIVRSGFTLSYGRLALTTLYSYTAGTFADPLNIFNPSPSGATGWVPDYHLTDFNLSWQLDEHVRLLLNINNAFDRQYFTKRPQFYPGPGVWPSDGRTWSVTAFIKL